MVSPTLVPAAPENHRKPPGPSPWVAGALEREKARLLKGSCTGIRVPTLEGGESGQLSSKPFLRGPRVFAIVGTMGPRLETLKTDSEPSLGI